MQELDFYEGLKIIRNSKTPVTVIHTELSLSKNKGGNISVLENVVKGPLKHNMHEEMMIGLQKEDGDVKHIYIHSILEIVNENGHFKLILN